MKQVSIMDSLSEAMTIWSKHFVPISLAVVIVYLPIQILLELLAIPVDISFPDTPDNIKLKANIYELIRQVLGAIATLGVLNFVINKMRQPDMQKQSAISMLTHGLKTWPRYFFAMLYAFILTFLYLLLLIVPGIYKGVRLGFVECVSATEDKRFNEICSQSESLVSGRWWYVFAFFLFIGIVQVILELLLTSPFTAFADNVILMVGIAIIVQLITIYFVIVRGVYYAKLSAIAEDHSSENAENLIDNNGQKNTE